MQCNETIFIILLYLWNVRLWGLLATGTWGDEFGRDLEAKANRPICDWGVVICPEEVLCIGCVDWGTEAPDVVGSPFTSKCEPERNPSMEKNPSLSGNTAVFRSSLRYIEFGHTWKSNYNIYINSTWTDN